jgi:hypothetical protein
MVVFVTSIMPVRTPGFAWRLYTRLMHLQHFFCQAANHGDGGATRHGSCLLGLNPELNL